MAQRASGQERSANKASWLERAVDAFRQQPEPPPKPAAPPVNQSEWRKSVQSKEVVPGVTVHDIGLSVFGETKSLHDRTGSNESLGSARQKVAHMIINGADKWGLDRMKFASTALPIEPSDKEKRARKR